MPKKIDRPQEFSFAIKKQLGILGTTQTGWTKEVNLVEWNGNPAKLDIRDWDPNHEYMGKGVTLRKTETLALLEILLRNFGTELAESIVRAKKAAEAADDAEDMQDDAEQDDTPLCDEDGVCLEETEQNETE